MPNLLTVSPGQIIEANDWNKVVNDLNMLTSALSVDNYKVGINNPTPHEALEIGQGFTFHSGGTKFIGENVYYGSGNDRYIANGLASQIRMGGGVIHLLTAQSGAADAPIIANQGGLVVSGNGNVGIGTTSPKSRLHIQGGNVNVDASVNGYGDFSIGSHNDPGFRIGVGSHSGKEVSKIASQGDLWLGTGYNDNYAVLMINVDNNDFDQVLINGNLGVGTLQPTQRLEVNGDALVKGRNNFTVGSEANLFLGDINHFIRCTRGRGITISTYQNHPGIFLKEWGNVGIGTDNPAAKLEVTQSSNDNWASEIINGGGEGRGLLVRAAYHENSTPIFEAQAHDGKSRFKVQANGKILINNSSPIFLRRYKNLGLNIGDAIGTGYNTGYSVSIYNAAVAGFNHQSGVSGSLSSYVMIKDNTWWIFGSSLFGTGVTDILFIRKEISDLIGY